MLEPKYPENEIRVPCLGRTMTVGMLYDARTHTPIKALTLWKPETLSSKIDVTPNKKSEFHVTVDDSLKNKRKLLDINADIQLSLICGLFKVVNGAAKYVNDKRSSSKQVRMVLKYSCTSSTKTLNMAHLAAENIDYPFVFDYNRATHVVTSIDYGADAIFVFNRDENNVDSCKDLQGKLETLLETTAMSDIKGNGSVVKNNNGTVLLNNFKCTFHGDVILPIPTTFQDALEACQGIPTLIEERNSAVAKFAYLLPLSELYKLCILDKLQTGSGRAFTSVRSISDEATRETEAVLEHIANISASANDLTQSKIYKENCCGLKEQVDKFNDQLNQFRSSFENTVNEMLPSIRIGEKEESDLTERLKERKNSQYYTNLKNWIETKKCEFVCLEIYFEMLKEFDTVFKVEDLMRITAACGTGDYDYVLCFKLNENAFFDLVQKQLYENINMDDNEAPKNGNWCNDDKITANIKSKIDQFKNFASANHDRSNLRFVVASDNSKQIESIAFCDIILFSKDGRKAFQPPNSPGQPQMVSNTLHTITISWTPPTVGAENVSSYIIRYWPTLKSGKTCWVQETKNLETQSTVDVFDPYGIVRYLFKIEAVCEAGKTHAGPTSLPMKTSMYDSCVLC